ncbi:MAG: 2Fe-2S iron-sulfur cluster binding domain-containing protein [bacterium]|nr:2Fe-2S iron-sulfur cluster binding domain-containing protein [bacterium]
MSKNVLSLDGREVAFEPGETLLQVARREGTEIPTLCHDPRLQPAGACRSCLVEIEGEKRLVASCMARATAGAVISSNSARVERHRRTLFALYLTDHPETKGESENELLQLAQRYGAPQDWGRLSNRRASREQDRNPYIHFDAARCILCSRCTRYCDEVEGVSAIGLVSRGPETSISTADELSLLDTTCELCGGCVDVCPTGALREKLPDQEARAPDLESVRTTCGYCGVGCQLDLLVDRSARDGRGQVVRIGNPPPGTTTNDGNLCVKGRFGYDSIDHGDRLRFPLIRGEDGELRRASWEEALERVADGLRGVESRHGAGGLGFVSSSRCTGEENYLVQKLARAVFGSHNVHQCAAT